MDPQRLVAHYRDVFEEQRRNITYNLLHTPGFELIKNKSDALLQQIIDGLHHLGLDSSNSILAIDGSFSYGVAESESSHKSDLDGGIYLLRTENAGKLEQQIDRMLASLGVESNLHLIPSDWHPTREDVLAKTTEIGQAILPFLAGKYIWGEYDNSRLIHLIGEADKRTIDELNLLIDERFWHMYNERGTTYTERLKPYVGRGTESPE